MSKMVTPMRLSGGELERWRREFFPDTLQLFNSMSCNHCIEPECLKGCPTYAYIKLENGIVFHDEPQKLGYRVGEILAPWGNLPLFRRWPKSFKFPGIEGELVDQRWPIICCLFGIREPFGRGTRNSSNLPRALLVWPGGVWVPRQKVWPI